METATAILKLKKLPFSKSWQNNFVSKAKNIINFKTGKVESTELSIFVYIPATTILQTFSSDREFLGFRIENKSTKNFEFNLLADKTENNNRRLAIMYVAQFFNELDIKFLIDDAYTLYIPEEELLKLNNSGDGFKQEFYNSLYIPKTFGGRKGSEETWSH
jgi:hypothetical protein